MRAVDLAVPAPACRKTVKDQQNRASLGGMSPPDLSMRVYSGYKVAGTRNGSMLESFAGRLSPAAASTLGEICLATARGPRPRCP